MAHTFTHLLTHIIFSTKDRRPFLDADLKERLFPYLGGIIRAHDGKALIINGPADHVHILASLAAKYALSDVMRELKADSSGWVHKHFPNQRDRLDGRLVMARLASVIPMCPMWKNILPVRRNIIARCRLRKSLSHF